MALTIRTVERAGFLEHRDAVARLRIEVFRAGPYLYDGDLEHPHPHPIRPAGVGGEGTPPPRSFAGGAFRTVRC